MKAIFITVLIIAVSAIVGNPVCWYLFKYTDHHELAQWLGMISAFTFLGGIVALFGIAGYFSAKNRGF